MLAREGVNNKRDVNEKRQRNQAHQRHGGRHRLPPPATENPQFYLNQIQQRRHQKPTPENRPNRRRHHPHPQRRCVGLTLPTITACDESDCLLQRRRD